MYEVSYHMIFFNLFIYLFIFFFWIFFGFFFNFFKIFLWFFCDFLWLFLIFYDFVIFYDFFMIVFDFLIYSTYLALSYLKMLREVAQQCTLAMLRQATSASVPRRRSCLCFAPSKYYLLWWHIGEYRGICAGAANGHVEGMASGSLGHRLRIFT